MSTLVDFNTHPPANAWSSGYTVGNRVTTPSAVKLDGVRVRASTTTASATITVKLWNSAGTLLASKALTQGFTAGADYDFIFSTPQTLAASTTYTISALSSTGTPLNVAISGVPTAPETHTGGSYSFTRTGTYYSTGDVYPAATSQPAWCATLSPLVSPPALSASLLTAAETDTSVPLPRRKRKAVATTASTNAAQPVTRRKARALAVVTEAGTALPITRRPNNLQAALTPVVETDAALAFGKIDPIQRPLVPVLDTATAVAITRVKRAGITAVPEADSAQPTLPAVAVLKFTPPVAQELMKTSIRLFNFFTQPISFAVVRRNGHYTSVRVPSQEETDALIEGTSWFSGGRTYEVSPDTATLLQADGYEVARWLVPVGA